MYNMNYLGQKFFKKRIRETHITNRTFNYSKNGITLGFALRVDIKDQLKNFKELLLKALEDVEQEINKLN